MKKFTLQGRGAYPGKARGEALVCPQSIQGWAGVSEVTGLIIETGHVEEGKSVKGKILVIPYGKGSTGWSGHFHSAAVAGFSPAGWVFSSIDSRCGVAAAALEIPAVADFPEGKELFNLIRTGDLLEIDGDTGTLTVMREE
ncbi:MAG: aconitase X swivel domain-containing protein [Candidatus Heteroscillospira sp.]|jgi:predicted aconitase with swiveling domain